MPVRPPPLLRIERLACSRAGSDDGHVLEIGNFSLQPGERLAVVGPSGCGKSTFLDLLAMILAPLGVGQKTDGQFVYQWPNLHLDVLAAWRAGNQAPMLGFRARHIGYVLQSNGLLPYLTVLENAMLGLRLLGRHDERPVLELLDRLQIRHLRDRRPGEISIGQRQRVAVARTLAHRPALVLADEPTAALDPATARETLELLCGAGAPGQALIVVSHDRELLAAAGLAICAIRINDQRARLDHPASPVEGA